MFVVGRGILNFCKDVFVGRIFLCVVVGVIIWLFY